MRILVLNYEFPPLGGGAGKATAAISKEMSKLGHEVRVITAAYGDLPRREDVNGYVLLRTPAVRKRTDRSSPLEMITYVLGAIPTALRMARQWKPDASIAFFGIPSGPLAYLLKLLHGIPYIISLRGGDVPGLQKAVVGYHELLKPLTRFLWHNAQAVVANSQGLRDVAAKTSPDFPFQVIPNGIDLTRFRPAETDGGSVPHLLFAGRIIQHKGLAYLLEALPLLGDTPYRLTLVGDGKERENLEAQAVSLGLQEHVTFAGWYPRDRLAKLYAEADLFVFPSMGEGMPNVVLEAMASGLPIVATRVQGSEELVHSGENGLLVPPGDAEALAGALQTLLRDADLRARMGNRSRAIASQYTWTRAAEEYLKLINGGVNQEDL